jgi:DNA/RNA endonuclease G (NUC1)
MIKSIFPIQSLKENIIHLKKNEFNIYYSCQNKYPYLVIQDVKRPLGSSKIDIKRSDIEDPFKPDPNIPPPCSLTDKDYDNYMIYGGSRGHNAPAGHHRTDIETWSETFLYSNMCPQEIVFNAGVWVVLESWIKRLSAHPKLYKMKVLTGSIPNTNKTRFNSSYINVPTHMFKIVLCKMRPEYIKNPEFKNHIYTACFIYPNTNIDPTEENANITKYLTSLKFIGDASNMNIFPLLYEFYNFKPYKNKLTHLTKIVKLDYKLSKVLLDQMTRAKYYGLLIYSKTLKELDKNWDKCLQLTNIITDFQYHREYYELAKARITKQSPNTQLIKTKKTKKTKKTLQTNIHSNGIMGGSVNHNIKLLTYNLCWGCMKSDNTSQYDITAKNVALKCKAIKEENVKKTNVCMEYIAAVIYNSKANIVHTQESANWLALYNLLKNNNNNIRYAAFDKHCNTNGNNTIISIATFYDNTKFRLIKCMATDDKGECGRPMIICEFLHIASNTLLTSINLHSKHGGKVEYNMDNVCSKAIDKDGNVKIDSIISRKLPYNIKKASIIILGGDTNDHGNKKWWKTPPDNLFNTNIKFKKIAQPPVSCCVNNNKKTAITNKKYKLYGDYFIVSDTNNIEIVKSNYIEPELNNIKIGHYISDHLPVSIDINIDSNAILKPKQTKKNFISIK